jgi:hypothetical protein
MNARMRRSAHILQAASEKNIEQRHVNLETKYDNASLSVGSRTLKQNNGSRKIIFEYDQNLTSRLSVKTFLIGFSIIVFISSSFWINFPEGQVSYRFII